MSEEETVQLVIDVEDAFGITITDEEAEATQTVGQLYNLICHKANHSPKNYCTTQRAYYQLRKALIDELCLKKNEISPKSITEKIIPANDRKECWNRLSKVLELEFPKLEYPHVIQKIQPVMIYFFWFAILWLIFNFIFINKISPLYWSLLFTSFTLLFVSVLFLIVTRKFVLKRTIPTSCQTLGELAKVIVSKNLLKFKPVSHCDIWSILTIIISDLSDFDASEIVSETHFKTIFPWEF